MSSELLDFTGRKNFDDLKFAKGYNLTNGDIMVFQEDCMRIANTNDKMVLEQCKLGLQLSELKAGKTWQSVINQKTGFAYFEHSFEDFCKDTFKFSGTKTYALMQIAKFVTSNSENEVHFIDEKYSKFSSSQLTELASVPSGQRHYFTPDMTIEQMRLVKKYIATDEFWYDKQKKDFDLLTYAKNYVESKKKPKALPASNPDVMDGQLSLFSEDNEEDKNSPEHQEFLKACEPWIELTDEKREKAIKIALIERVGEIRKQRIYEKYKQNPLSCEFVNFLKEEYGNSGWGVDGLNGNCDYKGYRITPFRGDWVIFMTWSQVASRIVALINTEEYLPKDNEEEIFPTSGKTELGEEVETDDQSEAIAPMSEEIEREYSYEADEYDEADEAQEDMRGEMETIEHEAEASVSEKSDVGFGEVLQDQKEYDPYTVIKGFSCWWKPSLKNREGIREFYRGFRNWEQLFVGGLSFIEVYRCRVKTGSLYAVASKIANICEEAEKREYEDSVRYFWEEKGGRCFETNKFDLEKYIPLHREAFEEVQR